MKKFYDCGIDLGTTNSCIASPNMDNTCTIIDNIADRMEVTPSAVWISRNGRMVIGQRAYTCTNVGEVHREFKRDMGTNTVYTFEGSGIQKTPVDLSSEILKSLRRDAARRLNRQIRDVVITVPAAFGSVQCEATKKAGELAGFSNTVLLQEPIAASVAYGALKDAREQFWLVFDYGGGTLDVSVISTQDGRLDNITSRGANHMGGKDLDRLLFEKVILSRLKKDYTLRKELSGENLQRLMQDVEHVKVELSSSETAYFETYTARDDTGKIIDGAYEVSRKEFEAAIREEVLKAVRIAREALDASGISEDRFSKIILVGGSTYVPLVRQELEKEFRIPLENTLNPMTVVAQGAALYAASLTVEAPDEEAGSAGMAGNVELQYDSLTSDSMVDVVGRITSDARICKVRIDCVAEASSESALWTSGWCDLLDQDAGVFDVEVKICKMEGVNLYRLQAAEEDGSEVSLSGNVFEIRHQENSLKLQAPPMPFAVGVLTTDGRDNQVDWIIEKDTKLPVKKTQTYRLNKSLDPEKEDEEFSIVIYEGENTYNPDGNNLLRTVHVRSEQLPMRLPEGTQIEITMDIDESRCVTVTGYVPLYNLELLTEMLSNSEENYRDYKKEMEAIKGKIRDTENTVDDLAVHGVDVMKMRKDLEQVKRGYEEARKKAETNTDDVHRYISNFYDVQTDVIMSERASRNLRENRTDSEAMSRNYGAIRSFGTKADMEEFDDLKRQYDSAVDRAAKDLILEKMDEQLYSVYTHSFEWQRLQFSFFSSRVSYTDWSEAAYWKMKGEEAIVSRNSELLQESVFRLAKLVHMNVGEAINLNQADLKIE